MDLQPLDLGASRVAFSLDSRMQATCVDGRLHQHALSGGELLVQLGILGRESEEECGHVVAHPRSCTQNLSGRV
ncbi:hypothetical protein SB2_05915 [Methylobacterium radiotolerans]|nr:hypothetical protein SB2_05915 [Methylobacterium radiotolerans]